VPRTRRWRAPGWSISDKATSIARQFARHVVSSASRSLSSHPGALAACLNAAATFRVSASISYDTIATACAPGCEGLGCGRVSSRAPSGTTAGDRASQEVLERSDRSHVAIKPVLRARDLGTIGRSLVRVRQFDRHLDVLIGGRRDTMAQPDVSVDLARLTSLTRIEHDLVGVGRIGV
jgi:hypothetical protein